MEIYNGFVWRDKLKKVGGSYVLFVSKDMLQYLGVTDEDKDPDLEEVKVVCKADKGKHGAFIGLGKLGKQ